MRHLFLFLKASQPGLFDERVTVSGHATKTGKYVQAYQANRKKRLKDVVEGDMFDEAPQWDFASIKDWVEEERAKKKGRTTKADIELAKKKEEIKRLAEIKSPTPKKTAAEHLDQIFEKQNKPDVGVPAFVILSKDGIALDFVFGHNSQNYAEHMRDNRSNQEVYETATVRRFSKKEWEQYRALQTAGKSPSLAEPPKKKPEEKAPGSLFAEAAVPKTAEKKEPWQMTRAEWYQEREAVRPRGGQEKFTRNSASQGAAQAARLQVLLYGVNDSASSKIKAAQKGELKLGKDEAEELLEQINEPVTHRRVIEKAIAEGKPVPPEVIADYPDLKPKEPEKKAEAAAPARQEKPPAPRDYGTPVANRIGGALKSGDMKAAIDAIAPLSPQETAEAMLRVGFTLGTQKNKAAIMAHVQAQLVAAAKAKKDGYEMREPTTTTPEKAAKPTAKPHRFNLDEPPGIQSIITHAWNTTMGSQPGAFRPLSQMTDKEIAYGWAYTHAAEQLFRYSVKPKGYVERAHHHIVPQIVNPDNIKAIDDEMEKRGLNEKHELDIGPYWEHGIQARKSLFIVRPFFKAATIAEPAAELVGEHRRLVNVLRSPSHADDLEEADEQEAELREYEKKAKRKKKVCKAFLVAPLRQLLKARAHG